MPPRISALVAVVAVVAPGAALTGCGSDPAGALSGKDASQVLAAGVAAAEAESSVHYVIRATGQSSTQTVTGDAGRTSGIQSVVTGNDGVEGELFPDGRAYVRGNTGGLEHTVGLPAKVAPKYADQWISVASHDALYQVITQLLTLHGIITQLAPTGSLQESTPGTVGGHQVIGVRGGLPGKVQSGVTGTAVLYVSTSAPTLPLGFSGQASSSNMTVTDAGAFTRWGEHVHLVTPANAVPFASIPTS